MSVLPACPHARMPAAAHHVPLLGSAITACVLHCFVTPQVYRKKWVIHIERITREKVNGEQQH